MELETAIAIIDQLIATASGDHLNPLQIAILQEVWHNHKYADIAERLGYTEGHIKDVSAELWQQLSACLGEKVSKNNLKAVLDRYQKAAPFSTGSTPTRPSNLLPNRSEWPGHPPNTWSEPSQQNNREMGRFVGREDAYTQLHAFMQAGHRLVVIQAQGGIGKTTLARRFLRQQFGTVIEFAIAQEAQNMTSVTSLVEERLYQLGEQPGREFGISLDRLKRRLQTTPIGILVDNLEPALDGHGRLIAPHRQYVDLLQTLADPSLQSFTLITSRDRLCESQISAPHYLLPGLSQSAWIDYCQYTPITLTPAIVSQLHQTYGGNAKAMEIVTSTIQVDFAGDMAAYWQQYQLSPLAHLDLANLVQSQFDRLARLDPAAYQLLCRLGCYRYQVVPQVPHAGVLALLWDLPADQQQAVIAALQNRSLLEHHRGQYSLHPAIRAESRARLRLSPDHTRAHQAAAAFWTKSVHTIETVENALQGLEAYHHYVEIQAYEQAAEILLMRRPTKPAGVERLGRTFYKLGLLQPMQDAIHGILDRIESGFHLSALYSILGVLARLSGNIQAAIADHQRSRQMAEQALSAYANVAQATQIPQYLQLRNWELHALLNIGICYVELGDLAQAQQVFAALHTTHRQRLLADDLEDLYNPSVDVFAAFVYASLGAISPALLCAQRVENLMQVSPMTATGHRLLLLGLTYKNLQQLDRAEAFLHRAISYGLEHHYPQVQANALSGLAEVQRCLQNYDSAVNLHQDAIAILEKLAARYDLAEAFFQAGITYQAMSNYSQSLDLFEQALALFQAMSAPLQIAKIQAQREFILARSQEAKTTLNPH